MQAFRELFILSGSSPDSVTPQDRTAYAGEGIAPLFTVYYTMVRAGKQMEKPRRTRKKTARRAFFAGWSNLPVKFCVRNVGTPGRSAADRTAWANEGGGQRAGGGPDEAADAKRKAAPGGEPPMRRDFDASSARSRGRMNRARLISA